VSRHLLVIGAQRCGTTFLHTLLDAHPDITMARPARPEPKVFCDPVASAKGLDWYEATYFAHAGSEHLLGEKSTSYLEDAAAPARAAAMLGPAHIRVMLRDPVERAVSNWQFSTEHGLESRPLETALRENLDGATPWDTGLTSVSPFAYLERGRYMDYLTPWLAEFPDTLHVLFLSGLIEDDAVLKGLWNALEVDPESAPARPDGPVNRSEGQPPGVSAETSGRLRTYFEASDRALSTHLGRTLPW